MRIFLFLFLFLMSFNLFADTASCYSETGKLIYSHRISDFDMQDNFMWFQEYYSHKWVITDMDCIIKIDDSDD